MEILNLAKHQFIIFLEMSDHFIYIQYNKLTIIYVDHKNDNFFNH